jgi:hypothetical protein
MRSPMGRRTIVALAAACGLALIVLPAPVAPAQTSPPGGTTSTAASGGSSTTGAASGATTPSTGGQAAPAPGTTTGAAPKTTPAATPAPQTTTGATPTPPAPAKPGGAPATSTVTASASTDGIPAGIILLAVLGGLLVVIGLFVLLARFMGWGFERWQPTLHAWREAGYQTENAISEFGDWTRLGR